jgi:hypothetical protein
MKVESIDSKMPFKFCGPRTPERVPEGVKFFSAAALTFWVPILLYCVVIGQAQPLFVMVSNEALGVLIGVLLYKRQPGDTLSCVPKHSNADALRDADDREYRKAA